MALICAILLLNEVLSAIEYMVFMVKEGCRKDSPRVKTMMEDVGYAVLSSSGWKKLSFENVTSQLVLSAVLRLLNADRNIGEYGRP